MVGDFYSGSAQCTVVNLHWLFCGCIISTFSMVKRETCFLIDVS